MSYTNSPRSAGGLDWKWVGIGALIMFGLTFLAGLVLLPLVGGSVQPATTGGGPPIVAGEIGAGRLVAGVVVSFAAFAIGGYIIGRKSPGKTILEAGLAAVIAVAVGLLIARDFGLANLLAGALVPFLAALLGGWLGERAQGTVGASRP